MNSCAHQPVALHSHLLKGLGTLFIALCTSASPAVEAQIRVYAESFAADSRVVEHGDGHTVEGYGSDFVRAVMAEAGYSADIEVVPWPRLMYFLDTTPNVLAFNLTRTPEREDRYHWIGEIRPVKFQLWGLRERTEELPRTLDEAQSLRISAYRNDVVEQYLLGRGFDNLVYVLENYDPMRMLRRRRIDLIPYSQFGMKEFMAQQGNSAGEADEAGETDKSDELVPFIDLDDISTAHYLVMNKNSDPELVELFTAAFQTLVDNGTHQEILGDTLPQ